MRRRPGGSPGTTAGSRPSGCEHMERVVLGVRHQIGGDRLRDRVGGGVPVQRTTREEARREAEPAQPREQRRAGGQAGPTSPDEETDGQSEGQERRAGRNTDDDGRATWRRARPRRPCSRASPRRRSAGPASRRRRHGRDRQGGGDGPVAETGLGRRPGVGRGKRCVCHGGPPMWGWCPATVDVPASRGTEVPVPERWDRPWARPH